MGVATPIRIRLGTPIRAITYEHRPEIFSRISPAQLRTSAHAGGRLARLGEPVDFNQELRKAGWTAADFKRVWMTNAIVRLAGEAGFQALLDEIDKRHRAAEAPARRKVLQRLLADARRQQ
jgi:hypothetical protein